MNPNKREQVVAANALILVSLRLTRTLGRLSCFHLRPPARAWTQTFCEKMPRLANAPAFNLDELVGASIYDFVGCVHGDDPFGVEMLFIRVEGDQLWHRLFLQAGIGFWEKWPEDEAFGDYLDYRRVDFGKRWGLSRLKILSAECIGPNWEDPGASEFKIGFEHGLLTFRFSDPDDGDSEGRPRFPRGH